VKHTNTNKETLELVKSIERERESIVPKGRQKKEKEWNEESNWGIVCVTNSII